MLVLSFLILFIFYVLSFIIHLNDVFWQKTLHEKPWMIEYNTYLLVWAILYTIKILHHDLNLEESESPKVIFTLSMIASIMYRIAFFIFHDITLASYIIIINVILSIFFLFNVKDSGHVSTILAGAMAFWVIYEWIILLDLSYENDNIDHLERIKDHPVLLR